MKVIMIDRSLEHRTPRSLLITILLLLCPLIACRAEVDSGMRVAGGDPDHAPALIRSYGCGTCHSIPGIRGATGEVGPPLTRFGRRAYIAGAVPNTPDYLVTWIKVPQAIEPGTVMPTLGVTDMEARHIAAYLYTLDD